MRIDELLAGEAWIDRVRVIESAGSTNDELRALATAGAPEGSVVIADHQTAGRGRMGRAWHSAPGLGLYVSVLLRPAEPPRSATRWTVAASVAACEACRQVAGCRVTIDWPNDLVFSGRKLAGILAELRSGASVADLVLGTGFNVHHTEEDFPSELRGRATSLSLASGRADLQREQLVACYLTELAGIVRALRGGDWEEVAGRWESMAPAAYDRRVRVAERGRPGASDSSFEGVTCGLDSTGALRVRREKGEIVSVRAVDAIVPLSV